MARIGIMENLLATLIASVFLIIVGIGYFLISLWIVKFSAGLLNYSIDGNWAIVSAAILVTGIMIGSAIKNT